MVVQQVEPVQRTAMRLGAQATPDSGREVPQHDLRDAMRQAYPSVPVGVHLPQVVQERRDEQVGVARARVEEGPRDADGMALIGRGHPVESGQLRGRQQRPGERAIPPRHRGCQCPAELPDPIWRALDQRVLPLLPGRTPRILLYVRCSGGSVAERTGSVKAGSRVDALTGGSR
jgi:hypothetical protein